MPDLPIRGSMTNRTVYAGEITDIGTFADVMFGLFGLFHISQLLSSPMRVLSGCARVLVSDVYPRDGTMTGLRPA